MRTKPGIKWNTSPVSFKRDGEYFYRRALENRRNGYTADALRLVRKALEAGSLDGNKLLEAAVMAAELHLTDLSSHLISRAMLAGCDEAKCLYALGKNLLERSDIAAARRAGDVLLEKYPKSPHAGRYLDDAAFWMSTSDSMTRRGARSVGMVKRAFECVNAGNEEEGSRLMRRALALEADASRPDEARWLVEALAADAFVKEDPKQALQLTRQALRRVSGMPAHLPLAQKVRCVSAQTLIRLGLEDEARQALKDLAWHRVRESEYPMAVDTMRQMGMYEEMHSFASGMLAERGFHRGLLHTLSASAFILGMDDRQVLKGWTSILDVNRDDLVTSEYAEAYKAGELDRNSISCYPDQAVCADPVIQIKLLDRLRSVPPGEMSALWQKDGSLRRRVAYMCCLSGPDHLRLAAAETLLSVDATDARLLAALLSMRPDMPPAVRQILRLRADRERIHDLIKRYPGVYETCSARERPLVRETLWVRAMYENACRCLHDNGIYGEDAAVAGLIETVLTDPWARKLCMRESDIAEAAFVWKRMRAANERADIGYLLKDYSLTFRQIKRMLDVIGRAERNAKRKEASVHV
ncbi:MAG: hypothetical protein II912_05275 [Clostridia bacterium]|nr:hypothetical protein [Clostridia bacterium]